MSSSNSCLPIQAFSGLRRKRLESQALFWNAPHVGTWIDMIGLRAYKKVFLDNGVDGCTLLELRRDQFERCLGLSNPLHELSLRFGLIDLKCKDIDYTQWQWTCSGVVQWLALRGLSCLIQRFTSAAIHGGVLFRLSKAEFASRLFVGEHGESELVLESLWRAIQRARKHGYYQKQDDFRDWGPMEIKCWLESIHLGHLIEVFREHCVNGTLLVHLDKNHFRRTMKLTEIQTLVLTKAVQKLLHPRGGPGKENNIKTAVKALIEKVPVTPQGKNQHGNFQNEFDGNYRRLGGNANEAECDEDYSASSPAYNESVNELAIMDNHV